MRRPNDLLSALATLYLSLPGFVFAVTWLEPALGIPVGLLAFAAISRVFGEVQSHRALHPAHVVALLATVAVVWSALGGAGHFFYANPDWKTRDAVYADLILTGWPPEYAVADGAPVVLRTAFGYFLPPALVATVTGLTWAPLMLFLWTAVGVWLFLLLLPLPKRGPWHIVGALLLVVFFSGMDYPAILAVHGHAPIFPLPLEWWRPWTYTSLTAQLFWAPNHALALWLGTLLLYRHRDDPALPSLLLLLFPLLLIWTPFAIIGLFPWVLWIALTRPAGQLARLKMPARTHWLASMALTIAVVALFSRHGLGSGFSDPDPAGRHVGGGGRAESVFPVLDYVQFVFFEFGALVLLLRPDTREDRGALIVATAVLMLIPFIRFGPSNDWMLRVSTPSLLMLCLLVLKETLDRATPNVLRRSLLIAVLLLGAITPWFELARAVLLPRTPPNYGASLLDQQGGHFVPHYFGVLDRPEIRWAFRVPAPVPAGQTRHEWASAPR